MTLPRGGNIVATGVTVDSLRERTGLRERSPVGATTVENRILTFTRDEAEQGIERGARRRLKMSARELVDAYRSGRPEDLGAVADLLALASLLTERDSLFVPA